MKLFRSISVSLLVVALMTSPFDKIVQPVLALATDCATSSPPAGDFTVSICLSDPAANSSLTGEATVTTIVTLSGAASRVQRVVFYLNGDYLLTDYERPFSFILPTHKWVDGSYTISVEAVMSTGFVSGRASLPVDFNNGISTPPVNSNQFTPATGTTPPAGTPFTVAASGDGASGELNASKVTDLIASLNPNLFIYLGDIYENGTLTEFYNWYGSSTTNFGRFREITNPTIGNHEYKSNAGLGYFDYWDNIPNYYSYNAGGWHFISLNSNGKFSPTTPTSAQYKWLEQDLVTHAGVCTMVYYHHPLYNIGTQGPGTSMVNIWKLLAQHGVDIVLNGHDHNYQRWVPMNADGEPTAYGITEFVAGGGGHGLQDFITTDSRVAYSNDANPTSFGILLFQLSPDNAQFSYYNTAGSVLDSGVIPCQPPDVQPPSVPDQLTAKAVSPTRVNLSWAASSDDTAVDGYTILRNDVVIQNVPASSLTYSDISVKPATVYRYGVQAYDKAGNISAVSMPAQVKTPVMPARLILIPVADTYVNSAIPLAVYGHAASLRVDFSPRLRAYLRFNVPNLGGKRIIRARLLVFARNNSAIGVRAMAVKNNTWSELSTNFSNSPAFIRLLGVSGSVSAGTWVTLNVTGYITAAGTFSIGINTPDPTLINLAARESGITTRPRLILDLR